MQPRTIVIAGGAGGMGRAIAVLLGAAGDQIALADLPGTGLDEAVAAVQATGAIVRGFAIDLRDTDRCAGLIRDVIGWSGGMDVLINAAGVWLEGPSQEVTPEQWDRVLDINLKGAFFLIRSAIDPLIARKGTIINIASDAGLVGNSGAAVYCASKGGLVLLSKALALELAPQGVRVNVICPGDVATPMIEFQATRYGNGDPDGYKQRLLANYPQGDSARFIRPQEIARLVQYLCEPAAAPITGATVSIDFGITAGY
jgi:NAD(P)-dependent dehydrogenase (short-subunit alcohol dehydrogenase family)